MEHFAFWFYCLVMFPLALESLAGPIALGRYGWRVVLPVAAVLWVAPAVVLYFVFAAPEILIWMFPLGDGHITPPLEALICYTLPVWLALLAIWVAARLKQSLIVQSFASAAVSAAMLMLVSPPLQTWVLQNIRHGG
jgi:hypothetical protein